MTTPDASAGYLREHLAAVASRGFAVFNPHGRPLEDLPVIYGFRNGGDPESFFIAVALAADGEVLGNHCCSDERYMPADLGMLEGTREDRHREDYQKHYPDGYRMEFVPSTEIAGHAGLQSAIKMRQAAIDNRQSNAPSTNESAS